MWLAKAQAKRDMRAAKRRQNLYNLANRAGGMVWESTQ